MALPTSVFAEVGEQLFRYRYDVTIRVGTLVGGTPTDDKVAEGWIKTKLGVTAEDTIRAEVEKVMDARGVTPDLAVEEVAKNRHLSGFKRDFNSPLALADQQRATTTGLVFEGKRKVFTPEEARRTFGELLFEGRQLKAMLKEALMVAVGAGHIEATRWGKTSKAAKGFFVEHCFIEDDIVLLGVTEADRIVQSFVHTWRGAGIKLEEMLDDAELNFTIICDFDFASKDREFFAKVFSVGERNGLGASRSQGFGKFAVTRFERVIPDEATLKRSSARVKAIRAEEETRAAAEERAAAGISN